MSARRAVSIRPVIVFRTDANRHIGMGHLLRCIAIAEATQHSYDIHFVVKHTDKDVLKLIELDHAQVHQLPESCQHDESRFLQTLIKKSNAVVVLDGYQFDNHYQARLRQLAPLFVIDDLHNANIDAECVLNHAPFINPSYYHSITKAKLCLGLEYAMIRQCFIRHASGDRAIPQINEVCVCFGGTDFKALIKRITEQLVQYSSIKRVHVIAPGYSNPDRHQADKVTYYSQLGASQIASLMDKCQLIICPASTISIEALVMKMIIITGITSDNQQSIHAGITQYETVKSVGDFRQVESNTLHAIIGGVILDYPHTIKPCLSNHRLKDLFDEYTRN